MEEKESKSILNNINVKTQPVTTWFGRVIIIVSIIMFLIQHTGPPIALLYGVEKSDIDLLVEMVNYPWYILATVLCVGVTFLFLNEEYFKELFGIAKGYLRKKSDA